MLINQNVPQDYMNGVNRNNRPPASLPPHAGEAVNHDSDQRPVRQTHQGGGLDRVEQLARLLGRQHRVLPRLTTYFGPRTELAGLDSRIPPVVR